MGKRETIVFIFPIFFLLISSVATNISAKSMLGQPFPDINISGTKVASSLAVSSKGRGRVKNENEENTNNHHDNNELSIY